MGDAVGRLLPDLGRGDGATASSSQISTVGELGLFTPPLGSV